MRKLLNDHLQRRLPNLSPTEILRMANKYVTGQVVMSCIWRFSDSLIKHDFYYPALHFLDNIQRFLERLSSHCSNCFCSCAVPKDFFIYYGAFAPIVEDGLEKRRGRKMEMNLCKNFVVAHAAWFNKFLIYIFMKMNFSYLIMTLFMLQEVGAYYLLGWVWMCMKQKFW